MTRLWRLDDSRQTLVLGARADRLAEVVYWGPPLPGGEDLEALYGACAADLAPAMLDETPALTICPEAARSFPGQPGLVLHDAQKRRRGGWP